MRIIKKDLPWAVGRPVERLKSSCFILTKMFFDISIFAHTLTTTISSLFKKNIYEAFIATKAADIWYEDRTDNVWTEHAINIWYKLMYLVIGIAYLIFAAFGCSSRIVLWQDYLSTIYLIFDSNTGWFFSLVPPKKINLWKTKVSWI